MNWTGGPTLPSDISMRASRKNAEELRQIQEQHQRLKERTIANNEKQIRGLEQRYRDKKKDVQTDGRAAISHLKESGKKQVDQLQTYHQKRIKKIKEANQETEKSLKENSQEKVENINSSLERKTAKLQRSIEKIENQYKNRKVALKEETDQYAEQQNFRKKMAYDSVNTKIDQIQHKNQQQIKN